ncbi:ACRO protein, partial [Daphoenositta chrysoptera]|nr:ACRO protein [Daphoenositta chrysoptera]
WPGIASIQITLENGTWHVCAGALIGHRWVLTAAHCFIGAGSVLKWKVVMGATDLSQPGPEAEVFQVKRILVHHSYNAPTAWNNIALLELEQPVECSDYIQLGCVPDSSLAVAELKTCYIAGWRAAPGSGPGPLPSEPTQRSPHPKARNAALAGLGTERAGPALAAAPDPSLPAQGDIGGPLVCRDNDNDHFWLVGLASWGKGCAGARRPGIFTSTQHFHAWICAQTGL